MDWDAIDPAPTSAVQPTQQDTAAWDQFDPATETVNVTGQRPETMGQAVGDLGANVGTGVARIPGAIIGTPHTLVHTGDWAWAKLRNMLDGGNRTGADVDQSNPLAQHTLSSEEVDKGVFKGISAVAGKDVQPYEPTSFIGKLLQAGVTGAGIGLIDPAALAGVFKAGAPAASMLEGALGRMGKMAFASDAANVVQQALPDSPGLAATAAFLAHAGAGAAVPAARAGFDSTVAPLLSPTKRGAMAAGKYTGQTDNSQPGLANPTRQQIAAATGDVKTATDDIGHGQDDYDAGGTLRGQLQGRQDVLEADRKTAADDAYDVFRSQPPMPGVELAPFMSAPAFKSAIKEASAGRLNRGQNPLTDYFHFDPANAGEPTIIPNAAVPPDVLQRIKGALDDAVNKSSGNVEQGDISSLRKRFVAAVDARYPQTYPPTRAEFATNSRPLDPFNAEPTAKVLDNETNFGNRNYSMPQDKVVRAFLQQNSTSRSSFENLIKSFGGDRKGALQAIEDNLANKVQGAVNSDGTLDQAAFERSVRPYTKALGSWFPELSKKFSTARGAQTSLELLKDQKGLADDISTNRALRGDAGFVTRDRALQWLNKNADTLDRTQGSGAVMRLKKLADVLPDDPGAGAQAAIEAGPTLLGTATGGLEGGVLGAILHKVPAYLTAPIMKRYYEEYSKAIEKAFTDPAEAKSLADKAVKFGGYKKVLQNSAKDAARATLPALLASTPSAPQ